MKVDTFNELENKLENWINFNDEGGYDFVGALNLLAALLRNLEKNAIEDDFDIVSDFFDENELKTLNLLVRKVS